MSDWKNDINTSAGETPEQPTRAVPPVDAPARPPRRRRSDRYEDAANQQEAPASANQEVPVAPQGTTTAPRVGSRYTSRQGGLSQAPAMGDGGTRQINVPQSISQNDGVRRPLNLPGYSTRQPLGTPPPQPRRYQNAQGGSEYGQGYAPPPQPPYRPMPPEHYRRPVTSQSSDRYPVVEQPVPKKRGGFLAFLVVLLLLVGLVVVGFLLIDEQEDSILGQAKRTVIEQVSGLLGLDGGMPEQPSKVSASGFSATINSGTAPMDVYFNLITDKAAKDVRLVDEAGMPLGSISTPRAENSDSMIWLISLHVANGYQGNVQAQVFDGSSWLNTDQHQQLAIAEPVVPTASIAADVFAQLPMVTDAPTQQPTQTPAPTETPAKLPEALLPVTLETLDSTDVPTQTPTETPAPTDVPTIAPTETPDPTDVPTLAPTETPEPVVTPTPTMVLTPTPTMIVTPTPTMIITPTPTQQPTQTPAPTNVPTLAPTETPVYVTQAPLETPKPTEVPTEAPTQTPVPTQVPTPVPTEKPSPTPVMLVEAAQSADPSLIHDTVIYNKKTRVEEYLRVKALNMPAAGQYMTIPFGVLSFRGDAFRQNAAVGTVDDLVGMSLAWTAKTSSVKGSSSTYYGVGWTGQPAIIKWSTDVRAASNIVEEKKNTKALKEVIVAGLDGRIYFLDLADGVATRKEINVGYPMRGTPSLHPLGFPIMTVGQYARKMASGQGDIGLRFYNLLTQKQVYWIDGLDGDDDRPYYAVGAFDTSALIDPNSDTLVTVGTNGMLYTVDLGTSYDLNANKVSIDPLMVSMKSRTEDQADKYVAVESSPAMYGNYVFYADMQGILRCVDTTTMTTAWAVETGDAVQAAIALDLDADGNVWLYTANVLENRKKGDCTIRRYNASTGEEDWAFAVNVALNAVKKEKTPGAMASPVIGQGVLGDLVYFTLTNVSKAGVTTIFGEEDGAAAAVLMALDKKTGDVVWANELSSYGYSSPVAVYSKDGTKGWIIQADASGKLTLFNGKTGEVVSSLKLEGTIEASPAVYNNMLVIATTEKNANYIYGVKLEAETMETQE